MKYYVALIVFIALGCQKSVRPPLGESTIFFPTEVYRGSGAVWKYYIHLTPTGGQRKTNIKYRKIVANGSKLFLTDYAADFQESYAEVITLKDDKWIMDSTYSYNYRSELDSLRTTWVYDIGDENVFMDWSENTANLQRTISKDEWRNDLNESHNRIEDNNVGGKRIKTFYGNLESQYYNGNDTTVVLYDWRREFAVGKGMTHQFVESEHVNYEWQLDEIMSFEEFENRANHGMRRVAYIDPEDAIEGQNDFSTCYHISQIRDYYNDDRAQHVGGKGGLWEMLEDNLDVSLLKNQEGYFTFRFVVNCEGKAGRFITEEADLEFNRVEFSEVLRNHFLKILLAVPKWKNLTINGEPCDAYVYVTFKIKNDEIIEILP